MRKPRDFDAELKSLNDRARDLKSRKLVQLDELVSATAADALPVEQLAGVLLAAVETADTTTREGWRRRGAAFFQKRTRDAGGRAHGNTGGEPAGGGGAPPLTGKPGSD